MIAALFILLPVVGVVEWAFFRFGPIHANPRAVLRFNLLSLTVALLFTVAWTVRYLVMSSSVDWAWWPVISVLGALIIIPLVLALAGIFRNLVVFRRGTRVPRQ